MSQTVLLCDDAMFSRMMISAIVTQAGYEVIGEAENGHQAIAEYDRLRPDIVLMDIVMPDMSGLDATREIRRLDPKARIVMCSAMSQDKLIAEAFFAGASGFLVKPVNAARVVEALGALVPASE